MIYFRSIHYKHSLNTSFYLKDGCESMQLDRLHIGDVLVLMWNVSDEIAESMRNINQGDFYATSMGFEQARSVHIPFKVVERRHAATEMKMGGGGALRYLGLSITVEAENGHWEDLWKWIEFGDRPVWANEVEESENEAV